MAADDVQLPDLEVIQRYSLAVRGASAPRADVIAALQADLDWLTAGGGRPAQASPTRSAAKTAAKAPARTTTKAPAKAPAAPKRAPRRAPAKRTTSTPAPTTEA